MFPTQGPGVPVTIPDFSSRVNSATNAFAFTSAASHPMPVVFARKELVKFPKNFLCEFRTYGMDRQEVQSHMDQELLCLEAPQWRGQVQAALLRATKMKAL
jgi:hypothetical protein